MAIEWWHRRRLDWFPLNVNFTMRCCLQLDMKSPGITKTDSVSLAPFLSSLATCWHVHFLTFKAIHGQKANKCIYQIVGTIPSWEKIYLQECKMVPKLCHHIDQTSCSCNLLMGACTEAMLACFSSHDRSVHQDLLPWIYVQAFMVPRGYDWLFLTRHREVDVVLNEKSILI